MGPEAERNMLERLRLHHQSLGGEIDGIVSAIRKIGETEPKIHAILPIIEQHRTAIEKSVSRLEEPARAMQLARLKDELTSFTANAQRIGLQPGQTLPSLEAMHLKCNELLMNKPVFEEIRRRWNGIKAEQLYIHPDDVRMLTELSQTERTPNAEILPEFGGGARLRKTRAGIRICPAYSNWIQLEACTPLWMEPFLQSKSHLFWHTHPANRSAIQKQTGLSEGDLQASEWGIPNLLAKHHSGDRTRVEIAINGQAYPVRVLEEKPKARRKK